MRIDVKKNTKRNMVAGFVNKIVLMIFPFVTRFVINNVLGSEYLGLNSLFASIIQVLALTELGFSSAMVYNMYKPIAENNYSRINALMNLYRNAYRIIGGVILFVGCMLAPFLPHFISGEYPSDINIYIIYLMQIVNTAISYFLFAYRQSLLVAYQREDVNAIINLIVQFGLQIVQVLLLLITRNYYFYVLCMPVFTIVNNVWVGYITRKMFPNIRCVGKLDKHTLKDISKLLIGTFIQKACAITRNSLDCICISAFLGLTLTAIYSNYYTIFNGITLMLGIVSTSLMGGVGNHVSVKSVEENFEELKCIDFLYMCVSGWCTACLLCLFQPFMKIWMGEKLMLPIEVVVLMCLYFYVLKMGDMRSIYSAANGLWWKMKYRSLLETLLNIILNVFLGKMFGVWGIVLATIISLFICNFIWSSAILFREYFGKEKISKYYLYHTRYLVVTVVVCLVTYWISNIFNSDNVYLDFGLKVVICVFVPGLAYLIIWCKTGIFRRSLKIIRK